jgi:hypothetical protein
VDAVAVGHADVDAAGPSGTSTVGRFVPSLIYDPVRDRLLLFGGTSADHQFFNEVWELSLSGTPTWTNLAITGTPPSGRYAHVAIYDPVRDRMVMYGGEDADYRLKDSWALALAGAPTWSQLHPVGTALPPSHVPSAIYDPIGDRMLVYGGFDGVSQSNLIALSLATDPPLWAELHPGGVAVPARAWHSAVYDPGGRRMVWTGGQEYADPSFVSSTGTYSLDLSQGPLVLSVATNDASLGHVDQSPGGGCHAPGDVVTLTAIPSSDGRFVEWSGDVTGNANPLSITMDRNMTVLARFEPLSPCQPSWANLGTAPVHRSRTASSWDPMRHRMMVFGDNFDQRVIVFDGALWSTLPTSNPPSARLGAAAAYDSLRDRWIVFGGYWNPDARSFVARHAAVRHRRATTIRMRCRCRSRRRGIS